jgi:hypothetical protein
MTTQNAKILVTKPDKSGSLLSLDGERIKVRVKSPSLSLPPAKGGRIVRGRFFAFVSE